MVAAGNVITSFGYAIVAALYYNVVLRQIQDENYKSPEALTKLKTSLFYPQSLFSIYSGALLVSGVIKIRKFFNERDAVDSTNTKLLTRHTIAFVCLLLGTFFWGTTLLIWQISLPSDRFLLLTFIGQGSFFILNFIACLMLYSIIKSWSTKDPAEVEPDFKPIDIADADFDLELNIRIWNALVSKRLDEVNSYQVRASDFKTSQRSDSAKLSLKSSKTAKTSLKSSRPSALSIQQQRHLLIEDQ